MKTLLAVIDIQEKLLPHISEWQDVLKNTVKLVKACKLLRTQVIATEQVKLGSTVRELRNLLEDEPITKTSFSCWKCVDFRRKLEELAVERCVLTGIETHICILQTTIDLLKAGYDVHVAVDCIGSRKEVDKQVAVQRMSQSGAIPTTAETVIYELLETVDHEKFRETLDIVKSQ